MNKLSDIFSGAAASALRTFLGRKEETAERRIPDPGPRETANEILKVTVLEAGKADAIVVQKGSSFLVIDTGEENDGSGLVAFLRKEGAEKVDWLILTHHDKDHIGGVPELLKELPVGTIILPDYVSASPKYPDLVRALKSCSSPQEYLHQDYRFDFAGCPVVVNPPASYSYDSRTDYDNELSLITTLEYGKHRLMFGADTKKKRTKEWLSRRPGQFLFMKWPHHGVYDSALKELLEETRPKYVAICDSAKKPAEEKTLQLLSAYGCEVLRTKDGSVVFTTDGNTAQFRRGSAAALNAK